MTNEKGQNLIVEMLKHPAMFGYTFLYIWFIVGVFGMVSQTCTDLEGLDLALAALAPFLGLLAMSVLFRLAPKLADATGGAAPILAAIVGLLPSAYLLCVRITALELVASLAALLLFAASCAIAYAFVMWQNATLLLPLNNFILTEGITAAGGCLVGGLVLLLVPPLLWPLICILCTVLCFGLLGRAREDAKEAPPIPAARRLRRDQVAAHIDKRIRVLFFLFEAAFGVGWCYAVFTSMDIACIALLAGGVAMGILVFCLRNIVGVSDLFVIHLIRICLAGCTVAFFLYYLGFSATRAVALGILIILWLGFWTIDDSLQLQQSALFGLSIAAHGSTAKLVNNGGFLFGWLLGLAAVMLREYLPPLELGVLVGIGILLLILGAWLTPLGDYESPVKILDREASLKRAEQADEQNNLEDKLELAVNRFQITQREREVLVWLLRGRTAKTIAAELHISEATAKTHTYNIYRKMDVHTQQDLITLVEELS